MTCKILTMHHASKDFLSSSGVDVVLKRKRLHGFVGVLDPKDLAGLGVIQGLVMCHSIDFHIRFFFL
jgi:hypothetical protein